MRLPSLISRAMTGALSVLLLVGMASAARAADVTVMISGGFSAALRELGPAYERTSGNRIVVVSGPSMGNTPQAIPNRLQRGEPADVAIMVGYALDGLIQQGKVVAGSRVDLARSRIAMAVRAGAPLPDISTVAAFKSTLLAAKSIAYSDSASGVYLSTELFPRLGIADQIRAKSTMIPAEPVGAVVARGDAEIGFQAISELRPVPGIQIVGPIPAELQKIIIFSGGVTSGAQHAAAAQELLAFLASPAAAAAVAKTGLDPIAAPVSVGVSATTSVDAARRELAPTGRLRVAIAISPLGGPFWSTNTGGTASGVPVDLGRELGRRLGVPVDYVAYENSGQITDAVAKGEWDVTFVPMDAERAKRLAFGPIYNVADATYLVRAGLPVETAEQLDRPGMKVAAVANTTTMRGAARSLKNTPVVGIQSVDEIIALLSKGEIDAFANLRDQLVPLSARIPGSRVLPGAFQQTKTAIAVPPGRPNALAYASAFLDDAKTGGFLRSALDAHGLQDTKI
jgi:molybdate transport system substrate-binding protein